MGGEDDRKRLKGKPREKLAPLQPKFGSLRISRLPKWKVTSAGYVNTTANVRLSMHDYNDPIYMISFVLLSL